VRRAFEQKPARAGVEPLVVFAHHDEIHVLRSLVLHRAIQGAVELHRAQVDVLLQFKTQSQQNALLENAWLDLGVAHGSKINRLELPQFRHGAVGQHFAGFEKPVAAEIVRLPVEFESEFFGGGLSHFEGFARHFRAGAVAADDCNVVTIHG
jgi:hypothetical protein